MGLLWIVTAGWAFSFSLIGVYLSGQVDDFFSVFVRTGLALLLFLPLMLRQSVALRSALALMGIGAIQIGMMYLFLFHAFAYLSVPELLLFTIFTPLYVALVADVVDRRRRLPAGWWLAASLAVVGAAIIRYGDFTSAAVTGFLMVQCANLCFAFGQVAYRNLSLGPVRDQIHLFGYFFLGATLVSALGMVLLADFGQVPRTGLQWGILIWLGLGASGLGYLGWNLGAKQVNPGQLAAMNNMLIPAGILVNFVFWNRDVDWLRLVIGGVVIFAGVWLAGHQHSAATSPKARKP